jgi:uncharacterized protein YcfL
MKKTLITLLVIVLISAIAYIIMQKNGIKIDSIINTPETIDLTVRCSAVNNLLITSEVTVEVLNNSSRTHNNVTVRITGYDEYGTIIRNKETTFDRTLAPNGSLTKLITMPAKTKTCNCELVSSNPE